MFIGYNQNTLVISLLSVRLRQILGSRPPLEASLAFGVL